MGSNNSNATSHNYDWLEESSFASWLRKEGVVEAVLGDPHPTGRNNTGGNGSGSGGGDSVLESSGNQVGVGSNLMTVWCLGMGSFETSFGSDACVSNNLE